MPTISRFYGILIKMFFYDTDKHHIPHIHAEYQGVMAVYSIPDGTVLAGGLPPRQHKINYPAASGRGINMNFISHSPQAAGN